MFCVIFKGSVGPYVKGTIRVMPDAALYHLFCFYASFRQVQNGINDTYVNEFLYGSHIMDYSRPERKLRPMVIYRDGVRQTEKDIREFYASFQYRPMIRTASRELPGFRTDPVPHTGKLKSMAFYYRSHLPKGFHKSLLRANPHCNSWKKEFKVEKAWMKHTSITSLRIKKKSAKSIPILLSDILDDGITMKDGIDLTDMCFPEWE